MLGQIISHVNWYRQPETNEFMSWMAKKKAHPRDTDKIIIELASLLVCTYLHGPELEKIARCCCMLVILLVKIAVPLFDVCSVVGALPRLAAHIYCMKFISFLKMSLWVKVNKYFFFPLFAEPSYLKWDEQQDIWLDLVICSPLTIMRQWWNSSVVTLNVMLDAYCTKQHLPSESWDQLEAVTKRTPMPILSHWKSHNRWHIFP